MLTICKEDSLCTCFELGVQISRGRSISARYTRSIRKFFTYLELELLLQCQ